MFKTVTVKVKSKNIEVKVFVKSEATAKATIEAYLKNKFSRIDPNHRIIR